MSNEESPKEVHTTATTSSVVPAAPPQRGASSDQQTEIRKELGDFERISIQIQRRVLYATCAIAAITGIYVFVTFRQWQTMQGQLGAMHSQLDDSRKAAAGSANVTEQQLRIAESQARSLQTLAEANKALVEIGEASARESRQATQREQMASIRIKRAVVVTLEINKRPRVSFLITNDGKTAAVHTQITFWTPPKETLVPPPGALANALLNPTIGAGDDFELVVEIPGILTPVDADEITSGRDPFFLALRVEYQDIFGGKHVLPFCGRVTRDLKGVELCRTDGAYH